MCHFYCFFHCFGFLVCHCYWFFQSPCAPCLVFFQCFGFLVCPFYWFFGFSNLLNPRLWAPVSETAWESAISQLWDCVGDYDLAALGIVCGSTISSFGTVWQATQEKGRYMGGGTIYLYIYIYIHVYVYAYTYAYVYVRKHVCVYVCM